MASAEFGYQILLVLSIRIFELSKFVHFRMCEFFSLHTPSHHVDHIIVHSPIQGWPPSATTLRSSFHSVWLLLCALICGHAFSLVPPICGHAKEKPLFVGTRPLLKCKWWLFPLSSFFLSLRQFSLCLTSKQIYFCLFCLLHFPFRITSSKRWSETCDHMLGKYVIIALDFLSNPKA